MDGVPDDAADAGAADAGAMGAADAGAADAGAMGAADAGAAGMGSAAGSGAVGSLGTAGGTGAETDDMLSRGAAQGTLSIGEIYGAKQRFIQAGETDGTLYLSARCGHVRAMR